MGLGLSYWHQLWMKEGRLDAIAANCAFLVYLRNSAGKMIGGGYFEHSHDEASYAVGAYDRSLFDKPLGHVVQFHAISEMKRRNLSWYRIGARAFMGDQSQPSAKEISISDFKQGFASDLMPRFELEWLPAAKTSPSEHQSETSPSA